jgi:hypothetical protein
MFLLLLGIGGSYTLSYFSDKETTKLTNNKQNKEIMIYTLTRFKRDGWSGHTTFGGCSINLSVELDRKTGQPVTGLTEKEARDLEEALFYPKGKLAPNSKYWQEGLGDRDEIRRDRFFIPFPNSGLKLDDESPEDRVKLAVLRSMKKVAVGREDVKRKSKAEYLLTSPERIDDEEDERFSVKEDAYALLSQASPEKQRQIYLVLEKQKRNGKIVDVYSMSTVAIKNALRKNIENAPQFFKDIAEDEKLSIKADIIELVSNRVLSYNNSGYWQKSDLLGQDLDMMVAFMEDPHNQPRVIQFKKELQGKKKVK